MLPKTTDDEMPTHEGTKLADQMKYFLILSQCYSMYDCISRVAESTQRVVHESACNGGMNSVLYVISEVNYPQRLRYSNEHCMQIVSVVFMMFRLFVVIPITGLLIT